MIKIIVDADSTSYEIEGSGTAVSLEACFALKGAVDVLRDLGKDDKFIRAAFEVTMLHGNK